MNKKYAIIVAVLVLILTQLACGGPNGCGDTVAWGQPGCEIHPENAVMQQSAVEKSIVDILAPEQQNILSGGN